MNSLILPSEIRHYTIDDAGLLYVHGNPTRDDFECAWAYICHIRDILPRVIGNLMCHAEKAEWGGPEYVTELMETTDRSRWTLYQWHSVYRRLSPANQLPGVKYSYDREAARLYESPNLQRTMLERARRGDFENSDQFRQAVRQALREPEPQRYGTTGDKPIPCPICGGNGWNREHLHWSECPGCGAHGDEALEQLAAWMEAVQAFYQDGDRTELDRLARLYKWT